MFVYIFYVLYFVLATLGRGTGASQLFRGGGAQLHRHPDGWGDRAGASALGADGEAGRGCDGD